MGGRFTVKIAAPLLTVPTVSVTVTVNTAPLSEATVAGVMYDDAVAPLIAVPFFFHWYVIAPLPVAATLKVAVCPRVTARLAGCVERTGGKLTVRTAAALVTLETLFVTFTVNCAALSAEVVAAVV